MDRCNYSYLSARHAPIFVCRELCKMFLEKLDFTCGENLVSLRYFCSSIDLPLLRSFMMTDFNPSSRRSARDFWPSFLEYSFDGYTSLSLKFTDWPRILSSLCLVEAPVPYFTVLCHWFTIKTFCSLGYSELNLRNL